MVALAKIERVLGRFGLAALLMLGPIALCTCPVAASEMRTYAPAEGACCFHEEAPERDECCGDKDCDRTVLELGADDAVLAETVHGTVLPAVVSCRSACVNSAAPFTVVSNVEPAGAPPASIPATLLFCVFTQ